MRRPIAITIIVIVTGAAPACPRDSAPVPTARGGSPDLSTWSVDRPLPDFALIDHDGAPLSFPPRGAGPTLVAFAFSRCPVPTACPQTMERVRDVAQDPRTAANGLRIVVVTLDPAHDTPPVLAQWRSRAQLDRDTVIFATGDKAVIDALASCFNVFVTHDMSHPVKAALLGADGRIQRTWVDNAFRPEEIDASVRQ